MSDNECHPFIREKKICSDYRVYGIQIDRLGLTVATQKSVLKSMQQVLRYQPKCVQFCWFGLEGNFLVISWDSVHIFQNQFLRWNRESEPVDLNTMNPIIRTNFFSRIKGSDIFLKLRAPKLNPLKNEKKLNFSYSIHRKAWELG